MFVKGEKHTKEFIAKATLGRRKSYGEYTCLICGKTDLKYTKKQILCGSKDCNNKYDRRKWHEKKKTNPILYKSRCLGGSIRLGKGKDDKLYTLVKDSLEKHCPYCGTILHIDNISLDHKIPRRWSKVYNRKTKKMAFSYAEIREFDRIENLHIICKRCNNIKGELTDEEFKILNKFFEENPFIKEKLIKRFNISNLRYGRK